MFFFYIFCLGVVYIYFSSSLLILLLQRRQCVMEGRKRKKLVSFSLFFFPFQKNSCIFFFLLWDPDFAIGCSSIIFSYLSVILSSFILLGRAVFFTFGCTVGFFTFSLKRTHERSIDSHRYSTRLLLFTSGN